MNSYGLKTFQKPASGEKRQYSDSCYANALYSLPSRAVKKKRKDVRALVPSPYYLLNFSTHVVPNRLETCYTERSQE
jgi:hypothetical protein